MQSCAKCGTMQDAMFRQGTGHEDDQAQWRCRLLSGAPPPRRRTRGRAAYSRLLGDLRHGNVAGLGEVFQRGTRRFPSPGVAIMNRAFWRMWPSPSPRRKPQAGHGGDHFHRAPGALNTVTAAALAHVNRLPVLLIPEMCSPAARPIRYCSRSRISDDGTVSANDCFPAGQPLFRLHHEPAPSAHCPAARAMGHAH